MSQKSLRFLLIVASTRPTSLGPLIADWFVEVASTRMAELGVNLDRVDLRTLALPELDEPVLPADGKYEHEHTKRWSATIANADGFFVVMPEYNTGMPGPFKNALDTLYAEWAWKPIGFIGYGNTSAGTRGIQHARAITSTLRLVPTPTSIAIRIRDDIDEKGLRPNLARNRLATKMVDEASRLAHALMPMRELEMDGSSPGPLPGTTVRKLTEADVPDVLLLQRASWVDEAIANERLDIHALHESVEDIAESMNHWTWWGIRLDGHLLAMVRTRRDDQKWQIGRLAVAPTWRGQGIGSWLLKFAEGKSVPDVNTFEIRTGIRSERNIALYESLGYQIVDRNEFDGDVGLTRTRQHPHIYHKSPNKDCEPQISTRSSLCTTSRRSSAAIS
jgi:NAD(P)H-dependent FMN reductase/GNAT superfamily N-acetyltransferase